MKSASNSHRSAGIDRRKVLVAGLATTGACLLPSPVWSDEKTLIPIVDCHQHLWDLDRQKLSWLKGNETLGRSFVMKDYLEAIEGTGISRAVYMEVDVDSEEKTKEGEIITELCMQPGSLTVAAVLGCIPDAPDFSSYLAQWKKNPFVRGFRTVLSGDNDRCIMPAFVKGIQAIGQAGFRFDLCTSPKGLANCVKLMKSCPGTRFIVDHCGNVEIKAWKSQNRNEDASRKMILDWKRDMAALAANPETICKISGIVAQATKGWAAEDLAPAIDFCLDTFGPDRVVVGSDWPVCLTGATLVQWITALREIIASRPESDQRKLLHENAVRHYAIEKLVMD
jgi:predicted TIM-barrel fold metal-dependent hydrolase